MSSCFTATEKHVEGKQRLSRYGDVAGDVAVRRTRAQSAARVRDAGGLHGDVSGEAGGAATSRRAAGASAPGEAAGGDGQGGSGPAGPASLPPAAWGLNVHQSPGTGTGTLEIKLVCPQRTDTGRKAGS